MSFLRYLHKQMVWLAVLSFSLLGQQDAQRPVRDPQSLEIVRRTVQLAGGAQQVLAIHDITEKGELQFHWGRGTKGPVTIKMLGANRFRLDYEVPGHKSTLTVRDGFGFEQMDGKAVSISHPRAINLGNLSFPIAHCVAAVADPQTEVSFVGIESRNARSVYRVRLRGHLGLAVDARNTRPVTKELIIDALTYDIVSVEDWPISYVGSSDRARSHVAQRQIDYSDFRLVNNVRLPFSIKIRVLGQETMTVLLNNISLNSNLRDDDFGP